MSPLASRTIPHVQHHGQLPGVPIFVLSRKAFLSRLIWRIQSKVNMGVGGVSAFFPHYSQLSRLHNKI